MLEQDDWIGPSSQSESLANEILNPIRPGFFSRSPGRGPQRPRYQKLGLPSTD